jgi:magnesium-transporting ATPase (P-type)
MKQLALSINYGTSIPVPAGVPNQGISSGANLIGIAFNLILILAIILGIAFIVYAGVQWAISGGDKQKIQQARARLTFAIIGLVVVVLAFTIVNLVHTILGI